MKTLREFVQSGKLLIAAHRGASGSAPENTMPAFSLAYEQGANMLETDIQFTADGHVVAFHDFEHININQKDNPLKTLSDFRAIDAGSWFDDKFKGIKIPTFDEILEFAKDKMYVNFEIKTSDLSFPKDVIVRMIDKIKSYNLDNHVMFASFNYELIKFIKENDSNIHTAAVKIPGDNTLPSDISKKYGCEAFICSIKEIDEKINKNCIENDIFIGVYSVDNLEHYNLIKNYNIAAYGTNFPDRMKEILA